MRYVTLSISLLMLAGYWFQTHDNPSAGSAEPFHARIVREVQALPEQAGTWSVIDKPQPPAAAQQLLRPNALMARVYRDATTSQTAQLLLVQCRDIRDMAGHWPPNCYPNSGWKKAYEGAGEVRTMQVDGLSVPARIYEFTQRSFDNERRIRIFCFFTIPGRGFITDLAQVRGAAEDYRLRPFGAAQVQVLVDADMSSERSETVFKELLTPLTPLLRDLAGSQDQMTTARTAPPHAERTKETP
jgi:hypothetical protein